MMSSCFLLPTLKIWLNKYVTIFLMKTLLGDGGGGEAFKRRRYS